MPDPKENQETSQPDKKCTFPCCSCSGWKMVLCVILGILVVAGAVYAGILIEKKELLSRFENLETPPSFLEEPTPTESEEEPPTSLEEVSPTLDVTADWKTYKNGQPYAFQLKYPPDWIEKTMAGSGWPYFESSDGRGIYFNAGPKGGISGNDTLTNYCQTRGGAGTILEKHDTLIDNNPSVYCTDKNKSIVEFMVSQNDTQYEIICSLTRLNTCLQILSTFKFLD